MGRNPNVKRIDYYPSEQAQALIDSMPDTTARNRVIDTAVLEYLSKHKKEPIVHEWRSEVMGQNETPSPSERLKKLEQNGFEIVSISAFSKPGHNDTFMAVTSKKRRKPTVGDVLGNYDDD